MSNIKDQNRRVVTSAAESVAKAIEDRKRRLKQPPVDKPIPKPLSEANQIERLLHLANLALNKYQVKLEDGDELSIEEERMFNSQLDSIRKLELALSALRSKADLTKQSDATIAKGLVESGMPKDQVRALYPDNERVKETLEDL